MSRRGIGGLAQAIALAALLTSGSAQDGARRFESILWLHGGPARDAAFYAAVKAAGYSAVSVSGGEDPAGPGRHGMPYYHDQLCGKGVLEMRAAQYDPVARAYSKDRDEEGLIRPSCLSEADTLAELLAVVGKRLDKTLPHRPWAISLGDEISVTRHANPLDLCFAPASLVGFQKFVAARYRTVGKLNQRWGTDFASFARVRPFTADRIRRRELVGEDLPGSLEPWAAHREFMDQEFARVVSSLVQAVARLDAAPPVGLTGIQQPSAYGGHDYARMLPLCTFYEAYDIGGARDLAMCLAPPAATQVATLFPPKGPVDPAILRAQLADLVAHGMSGVVVWSAGLAFDQRRELTPYGSAMSAALRELRPAADQFAGARLRRSDVWLVESQASVRAWWMLDSRDDGETWIKRLSSYEESHSTSLRARHGWIRLLEDLGLQPRLVPAAGLSRALRGAPPRVLILPATVAMSDAVAVAIEQYVQGGGVVMADHSVGLYDERLTRRARPPLDRMFGVQGRGVELGRQLVVGGRARKSGRLRSGAAAAEGGLRAAVSDVRAEHHLQMENEIGRGRTCYLNMAVCEYGSIRLDPKAIGAALDIRRRVRFVLRSAGVVPPVYLRALGMPTCLERMVLTGQGGRRLLAVRVNALESPELMARLIKNGPVKIELSFPKEVSIENLVSKEASASATTHTVTLDPSLGLFLRVEEGGK